MRPTEGTDIWFFVNRPKLLSLDPCGTLLLRTVLRPDQVAEKSTYQIAFVSLSLAVTFKHEHCLVHPYPAPPKRVRTPLPASAGGGHAATQPALTDVPTAAAASTARRITIISDSDDDVPLVKKKTERAKAAAASRCTCVDGAEMCSYCLQFEL